MMEWQWHQLDYMQPFDKHTSTPTITQFFMGRMLIKHLYIMYRNLPVRECHLCRVAGNTV